MNKDEAIKIVESGQKWAKGDDSQPQPNMIEVYEAIELLLAEVKNNSRLVNVSNCPCKNACSAIVSAYKDDGMEGMGVRDLFIYKRCKTALDSNS
jgi:hypothetical protein